MAGPFSFGTASSSQLATLHHDLQIILGDAIEIFDFSIHQGSRTVEEQIRNIRKGVSKTLDSRHIPRNQDGEYDPNAKGMAADCLPYTKGVNPWPQDDDPRKIRQKKAHRFYYLQGIFLTIAHRHDIEVIQGVDWDMDGNFFDQSFDDLPHIQLARRLPKLRVEGELLEMANEALLSRGLKAHA